MDTLGVLTVAVKHWCLIGGVARACAASSLLFTVQSFLSKSSKCISGSQNLGGWSGRLSRPRSRCGAVRIFGHGGHFSWQAQGKSHVLVVQSRLFVTGARDRTGVTLKCRFRGRCSTLDFVTGAVNRDFWTRGSFSEINGCLARKLHVDILTLCLEALLR